ncbi:hypothetical protein MMC13_007758 [Lambiella insularis]|nr:hypothetical protein [Lambiella insularis]
MLLVPSGTTAAPAVHFTFPPASLLKFPPAKLPTVLAPPPSDHTFARPFDIDPNLYNNLLSVNFPITIAIVYAATVYLINQANSKRDHKPWAFSKSTAFFAFMMAHNIFLAIYSAWTFAGMLNAAVHSWPSWTEDHGLTGVVDALCKINGPRGLGNAATFNSTTSSWGVTNELIKLADGSPDDTDVGRLWNEGLAYYGWLFYISKFYETLDTMIILAQGKKSSVLQTYHHAGAMMCMWAGMRYMTPPIWMFVIVNSGIHALMYTYYTFTALGLRAPLFVKKILTSLQIGQFVFGATYAFAHLFVSYSAPVNTPYLFTHNISSAIPAITSTISSVIASATASAGVSDWLKKIALRAAGEEGLAENVHNKQGQLFGLDAVKAEEVERAREEIRYKLEYPTVNCIDTSGQAFAILLNVIYLAPLTYLFVNFFVRSYTHRTSSSTTHPTKDHVIQKAGHDALKGVEREINEAMSSELTEMDPETRANLEKTKESVKATVDDLQKRAKDGYEDVKANAGPKMEELKNSAMDMADKGATKAKEGANYAGQKLQEGMEAAKPRAKAAANKAGEVANQAGKKIAEGAGQAKDKAVEVANNVAPKVKEAANQARDMASQVAENGINKAPETADQAKQRAREVADKASQKATESAEKARGGAKQAEDKAREGADKAGNKAREGKQHAQDEAQKAGNEAKSSQPKGNGNKPPSQGDDGDSASRSTLLDGDPSAYEVDFDELENKEEKAAEKAFQPKGFQPKGS